MIIQKRINRFILGLVFGLCFCVLNTRATNCRLSDLDFPSLGSEGSIVNGEFDDVGINLTLQEFAKHRYDSPWAQMVLNAYENGDIKYNSDQRTFFWDKGNQGSSDAAIDKDNILALKDSDDGDMIADFRTKGFWQLAGLHDEDATTIASLLPTLHNLVKSKDIESTTQNLSAEDIPDIIMLYHLFYEQSIDSNQSTPRSNSTTTDEFVTNLTNYLQKKENQNAVDLLELVYAKELLPSGCKRKLTLPTNALVQKYPHLKPQGNSELLRLFHPINANIYECNVNYMYDANTLNFVMLSASTDITTDEYAPKFTFEDAVRLRYAPEYKYNVVARDLHYALLMAQVKECRDSDINPHFEHHPKKDIKSFKDYNDWAHSSYNSIDSLPDDASIMPPTLTPLQKTPVPNNDNFQTVQWTVDSSTQDTKQSSPAIQTGPQHSSQANQAATQYNDALDNLSLPSIVAPELPRSDSYDEPVQQPNKAPKADNHVKSESEANEHDLNEQKPDTTHYDPVDSRSPSPSPTLTSEGKCDSLATSTHTLVEDSIPTNASMSLGNDWSLVSNQERRASLTSASSETSQGFVLVDKQEALASEENTDQKSSENTATSTVYDQVPQTAEYDQPTDTTEPNTTYEVPGSHLNPKPTQPSPNGHIEGSSLASATNRNSGFYEQPNTTRAQDGHQMRSDPMPRRASGSTVDSLSLPVRIIPDKTDNKIRTHKIIAICGGALLGLAQASIILYDNLHPIGPNIVYIIPFNILALGLIIPLLLALYNTAKPTKERKPQNLPSYYIVLVSITMIFIILWVFFTLHLTTYLAANVISLCHAMILFYQAIAILSVVGCLITRKACNLRQPIIAKHTYWVLYVLAAIFAFTVPFLSIIGLTHEAKLVLHSQILVIAALLFAAGAFIHNCSHWSIKTPATDNSPRFKTRVLTTIAVSALLATALIATIYFSSSYNTLPNSNLPNTP
ncbi:hypothetical protein NEHOM01_1277 [Nematocida homosporus]|uniref:uncharacterized protein n=1 Tax=Nematocida homosporus TaxID=1912981 RepID=UPI00221F623A|nr:uncharacterized protein NEHOM01_1277 [Nematocida homosporus]KAI5186095.1 hypothetical protein NEHOM01_1277 [Nematocida homosporus]